MKHRLTLILKRIGDNDNIFTTIKDFDNLIELKQKVNDSKKVLYDIDYSILIREKVEVLDY